ncbi:Uncharacterised protein [Catenibacterium mitsuokai]|nr:Uncharacterised protein [Catenibacterium mitsuokai]
MSQLGHYQLGYIETLSRWNQKYIKKLKKVVDEDFYLSYTDKGVR